MFSMFEDLGITLRKPFLVLSLAETTQDSQNLGKGRKKWLQNGDNPPSSSLNVIMAGKTWEVCSHLGENQTERERYIKGESPKSIEEASELETRED